MLECDLITGNDADYQLKVVVRDMEHYQHFLLDKLTHISGVTGVRSSFVLRRIKHKTALPSTTWADNPPRIRGAPKARGRPGPPLLVSAIKGIRGQHQPRAPSRRQVVDASSCLSTWLTSCTCSNQPLCSCRFATQSQPLTGRHPLPFGQRYFQALAAVVEHPAIGAQRLHQVPFHLHSGLGLPGGEAVSRLSMKSPEHQSWPAPTEWRADDG